MPIPIYEEKCREKIAFKSIHIHGKYRETLELCTCVYCSVLYLLGVKFSVFLEHLVVVRLFVAGIENQKSSSYRTRNESVDVETQLENVVEFVWSGA